MTTHDHRARLDRAAGQAGRAGLDGLVITPSPDLLYLLGYDAPLLERLTALLLRTAGDHVLVVPELEEPRARSTPAGQLVRLETWSDGSDPFDLVRRILPDGGAYGAADRMRASHLLSLQRTLPGASFVRGSTILSPIRLRKDEGEIELLARTARCADDAFDRITAGGLAGRTEAAVSRDLAQMLLEAGCDSAAFAIVGSGPNGASPHHEAGPRVIRPGDVVVLDFGGRVGGYCSDMTRTVSVGEPGPEGKEVHAVVLAAHDAAVRAAGPGVPAEEVDRAARRVVAEAGHGDRFIHRTGHGIGLEEHEDPYIVEGNEVPLEPGMCFSVEPGIYLAGRFGVRIEDIVTVTADGAVSLNRAPRDLAVVA